jgi:hypothetical protein
MSKSDHNETAGEDGPLRLVKNTERSKRRAANGRMDHTTKLSYWCLGIIVIALLFYFLANMITDAEELDKNTGVVSEEV